VTDLALSRPAGAGRPDVAALFEEHRVPLTGYAYRMLGSAVDAEEAVQDTFVRAWRGYGAFEGRAALRSWLYRIATNVCIDMLNGRRRRALPMDLEGPSAGTGSLVALPEDTWVQPAPDARVLPASVDPGEAAVSRETIRLAFVAALQHLPARQRAVLILRDVLRWHATEVADLLDTTVVSVKSTLQRARATMAAHRSTVADIGAGTGTGEMTEAQRALLARYVDAFERYDVEKLVGLLREDATLSMPPSSLWLQGVPDIARWWHREGVVCRGSRLVPVAASGSPALAQYRLRPAPCPGEHQAFGIQVLTIADDGIAAVDAFIQPELFPLFDLPSVLPSPAVGP
jgi:RNA polymerase sigma-70 factor (ECF subfamily)